MQTFVNPMPHFPSCSLQVAPSTFLPYLATTKLIRITTEI